MARRRATVVPPGAPALGLDSNTRHARRARRMLAVQRDRALMPRQFDWLTACCAPGMLPVAVLFATREYQTRKMNADLRLDEMPASLARTDPSQKTGARDGSWPDIRIVKGMKPFTHVLVPTDFSAPSRAALAAAVAVAKSFGAQLTLLHVVEPQYAAYAGMPFMPVIDLASEAEQAAWAGLKAQADALDEQVKGTSAVRRGAAWSEILEGAAAYGADLIVMGTHGHTGLARALIGSTAEKVVRMSTLPVLTVHAP